MEDFDTYDSASQYGLGMMDDTASMISGYTTRTQKTLELGSQLEADFDQLSVLDAPGGSGIANYERAVITGDEDFDGVLDDVKDETTADLPPHACR